MSQRNDQMEKAIDDIVVAQADDPTAWEDEAHVKPRRGKNGLNVMLRYIELKTGYNDDGPAWIGRVELSRSGRTVYFNGKAFKRAGTPGTYVDLETRELYWISGVKKRGTNRHSCGSGRITIEAGAVLEYLELVGESELDRSRFVVSESIARPDPAKFHHLENELFHRG